MMSSSLQKSIRSAVFGAAAAVLTTAGYAAPAQAFDFLRYGILPSSDEVVGIPIWEGVYIRHNVGYDTFDVTGSGVRFEDAEGWTLGGQIGYDKVYGGILFGAISDGAFSFAEADGRGASTGLTADIKTIGTIRARIGLPLGRFLVYGTGGVGFSRLEVSGPAGSDTNTLSGWVAGGGLEYMYWPGTSIRAEYTRLELDSAAFSSVGADVGISAHQIDIGFVRRF